MWYRNECLLPLILFLGKFQITPLKFRGDWILYAKVLEFGFYPLKFCDVWILHSDILEFRF